jgi:hypothetical protein
VACKLHPSLAAEFLARRPKNAKNVPQSLANPGSGDIRAGSGAVR